MLIKINRRCSRIGCVKNKIKPNAQLNVSNSGVCAVDPNGTSNKIGFCQMKGNVQAGMPRCCFGLCCIRSNHGGGNRSATAAPIVNCNNSKVRRDVICKRNYGSGCVIEGRSDVTCALYVPVEICPTSLSTQEFESHISLNMLETLAVTKIIFNMWVASHIPSIIPIYSTPREVQEWKHPVDARGEKQGCCENDGNRISSKCIVVPRFR